MGGANPSPPPNQATLPSPAAQPAVNGYLVLRMELDLDQGNYYQVIQQVDASGNRLGSPFQVQMPAGITATRVAALLPTAVSDCHAYLGQ